MKKAIVITGIVVYAMFALSLVFAGNQQPQRAYSTRPPSTVVYTQPSQTETRELYVVKDEDGLIAVREMSTGKTISKTDTRVAMLPEPDRKRLKNGIIVEGKRELMGLLEDICS